VGIGDYWSSSRVAREGLDGDAKIPRATRDKLLVQAMHDSTEKTRFFNGFMGQRFFNGFMGQRPTFGSKLTCLWEYLTKKPGFWAFYPHRRTNQHLFSGKSCITAAASTWTARWVPGTRVPGTSAGDCRSLRLPAQAGGGPQLFGPTCPGSGQPGIATPPRRESAECAPTRYGGG